MSINIWQEEGAHTYRAIARSPEAIYLFTVLTHFVIARSAATWQSLL